MPRDGRAGPDSTLAAVSLPPLPGRAGAARPGQGGAARPGAAVRSPGGSIRPPTPPPRPESSLHQPPPPPALQRSPDPPPLLHLPPSLSALDSPITLTTPRTVSARAQNLYVDTPFPGPGPAGGPGLGPAPAPARPCGPLPSAVKRSSRTVIKTQSVPHSPTNSAVITEAPHPCTKPPEKLGRSSSPPGGRSPPIDNGIICVRCGRCRCAACAAPRALPSAWLCGSCCLCSAEAALDTLSCMCCVKAAFYHCGERVDPDGDKEDGWVDNPCSCGANKWWLRWGCLSVMSTCLPCLLCYPVLKLLTRGAETCYQAATSQGCTCPEPGPAGPGSALSSPSDSEKRLLSS